MITGFPKGAEGGYQYYHTDPLIGAVRIVPTVADARHDFDDLGRMNLVVMRDAIGTQLAQYEHIEPAQLKLALDRIANPDDEKLVTRQAGFLEKTQLQGGAVYLHAELVREPDIWLGIGRALSADGRIDGGKAKRRSSRELGENTLDPAADNQANFLGAYVATVLPGREETVLLRNRGIGSMLMKGLADSFTPETPAITHEYLDLNPAMQDVLAHLGFSVKHSWPRLFGGVIPAHLSQLVGPRCGELSRLVASSPKFTSDERLMFEGAEAIPKRNT